MEKTKICSNCGAEFEEVLQKVEVQVPGATDVIRVNNSEEDPCCTDCMYEMFTQLLDSISAGQFDW